MHQVVIIGAGVVGAMIAYELSQHPHLRITLVEEKQPASASTQAALGVMMGVVSQKTKGKAWQLRKASLERYETLVPELRAVTGQTIPYNRQGLVLLNFHGEELPSWEKLAQIRQKQGFTLELWSREDLAKHCPHLQNNDLVGGIYSPRDGQINPTILTQALVTAAEKNGVKTLFHTKVLDLIYQDNHCTHLHTSQGIINLDSLVIAAGLGTTALSKSLEIRPVLGQAFHIKLPHLLGHAAFQPVLTGEDVHLVPLDNNEYWLGATLEFPDATGELRENPQLLAALKHKAFSFCPQLAQGEILRTWTGKRPRPEGKAAPVLETLDHYANVFLATGHYRNGVFLAPATAQWVCGQILGLREPFPPPL